MILKNNQIIKNKYRMMNKIKKLKITLKIRKKKYYLYNNNILLEKEK